jgi:hypothetical protein
LGYEILDVKNPLFNNNNSFEFTFFGKKFDYLLAHSIFTHASPNQINKCLSSAREVMKKTSIFISTFVVGHEDDYGDCWLHNEFSIYSWETIEKLYMKNGLTSKRLASPHPINQTWVLSKIHTA